MKQINNGFAAYYYLLEDGTIINTDTGKQLKPDKKKLYKLQTADGSSRKASLRKLYKAVFGKPFCIDQIENQSGEEWKEIAGTDGYYFVSNKGRIKSLYGYNAIILKPYSNQGGYDRVDIIEYGRRLSCLVHKLVAASWLPVPPSINCQLHHKDYNKHNNAADNLEYLTAADHAMKHKKRGCINAST